jgi:purine-nucleoside/S-methyl-5'-thioadenosine phosphorylase / adenosine deaminase
MEWREAAGTRWLEARMPGATAAFTTRLGGASEPPFDGLNLGLLTEDEQRAVIENRRTLAGALGFAPERVAIARQVHGADLLTHAGSRPPLRCSFASSEGDVERGRAVGGEAPAADGHVVTAPGTAALVLVADCVPVALAGPGGVSMLHCGWRGLAAGIVARGAEAVAASDAVIGPSIGPCCYQVGEEVLASFDDLGEGIACGRMLDLAEVARRLLRAAGVERIEASELCTSCEPGLFFSHRRDAGRTGRQAGLVWSNGEAAEPCPG